MLAAGQGVALVGDLGAGKTSMTRGLARGLGLDDPDAVASPTYLVAIEHDGPVPMLHIDAYLGAKAESFLLDGGLDYAEELGAVLVIEWADRIRDLWPERTIEVSLRQEVTSAEPEDIGSRSIEVRAESGVLARLRDLQLEGLEGPC